MPEKRPDPLLIRREFVRQSLARLRQGEQVLSRHEHALLFRHVELDWFSEKMVRQDADLSRIRGFSGQLVRPDVKRHRLTQFAVPREEHGRACPALRPLLRQFRGHREGVVARREIVLELREPGVFCFFLGDRFCAVFRLQFGLKQLAHRCKRRHQARLRIVHGVRVEAEIGGQSRGLVLAQLVRFFGIDHQQLDRCANVLAGNIPDFAGEFVGFGGSIRKKTEHHRGYPSRFPDPCRYERPFDALLRTVHVR